MKTITWKSIINQLRLDLIGKDSYRGVTLTYSWLANQFGHFSLGFIPTLLVYTILKKYTLAAAPSFNAASYVSLFWFLFEGYNLLGPLLTKKQSMFKVIYITSSNRYIFRPAWANVAFDTFTDLCFFWIGAFVARLFIDFSGKAIIIPAVLGLVVCYPVFYWYLTKMYQQYAQYPFQFRLSQWNADIDCGGIKTVKEFLKNKTQGNHLLVFGGRRSGKTSLSVAIGTEYSIRHKTCIYTTAMKLYNMFYEPAVKLLTEDALWTWRTASLIIIDDINPGKPVPSDLITPRDFLRMLDTSLPENPENRKIIREKNTVWVLGIENNKIHDQLTWIGMLEKIGVPREKVSIVLLKDSFPP